MTAPVFGVTDQLGLGSDWEPQGISPSSSGTRAVAAGGKGDEIASTVHNTIEAGTMRYIYKGAETNFPAAFAADSCDVGDIVKTNTLMITSIAIDYSPCAAGKRPMVTFTWRDGPTVAGNIYVSALAAALPTYVAGGVEIPTILTCVLGDADIQTSQWSLMSQFDPDLDRVGEFLSGENFGGLETIDLTFVGLPTSITSTGYDQVTGPGATTGAEASGISYGTNAYQFVKGITRS